MNLVDRAVLAPALAGVLLVSACSATTASQTEAPAATPEGSKTPHLPATDHVHAVAIDPADGAALMATHDGLFRVSPDGSERVGPVIDLMGFSVVGPSHYVASGHPGPGTDLPNPVGLIESTDGGRTWSSLSRAGESDFHALDAWSDGAIALGASLERSDDMRTWTPVDTPPGVYDLSTGDGETVVATTPDGVQVSRDGGRSWAPSQDAPLLQFVEHADADVAVALSPEGILYRSADAGVSWERAGDVGAPGSALAISTADPDDVLVLTATGVAASSDGGLTFALW